MTNQSYEKILPFEESIDYLKIARFFFNNPDISQKISCKEFSIERLTRSRAYFAIYTACRYIAVKYYNFSPENEAKQALENHWKNTIPKKIKEEQIEGIDVEKISKWLKAFREDRNKADYEANDPATQFEYTLDKTMKYTEIILYKILYKIILVKEKKDS